MGELDISLENLRGIHSFRGGDKDESAREDEVNFEELKRDFLEFLDTPFNESQIELRDSSCHINPFDLLDVIEEKMRKMLESNKEEAITFLTSFVLEDQPMPNIFKQSREEAVNSGCDLWKYGYDRFDGDVFAGFTCDQLAAISGVEIDEEIKTTYRSFFYAKIVEVLSDFDDNKEFLVARVQDY